MRSRLSNLHHFSPTAFLLLLLTGLPGISPPLLSAATSSIELSWPASQESYLGGYKIHRGTESGNYPESNTIDVGLLSPRTDGRIYATIQTLPYDGESPTFYFAITSYDDTRTVSSGFSNEVIWTPPEGATTDDATDSDNDGLSDKEETEIYGSNPLAADSDIDGIPDQQEVLFWGTPGWSGDVDGDGIINLLDNDSDNDGFSDGFELTSGSNAALAADIPALPPTIYADGETSDTAAWDIFDNDPAGALVTSGLFDEQRASHVVSLQTGFGPENGFRLRTEEGNNWDNSHQFFSQWSHLFSEDFLIYILIETSGGYRYLTYGPQTGDLLGTDIEIHHGLGPESANGAWHTYGRDLSSDLADAAPELQLLAVHAFLVRGNGKVDDIMLHQTMVYDLDSDNDGLSTEEEESLGTDQFNSDTDADGIGDKEEYDYWLPAGDVAFLDNDNDGLINILDFDSDNDGISDGEEINNGTDPAVAQIIEDFDTDSDGLSDEVEESLGTDPFNSDTDADGIGDKEEYDYWLPAGDGDITLLDSDSDGLINILDFDSDNDGTSDGEEISAGTDPAAPPPELPTSTVYEDGEDGDTYGWEIFDKRPRGASISNQIDKIRGNVITFQGAGTENGYRHTGWSNSRQFIASWHQKFPDDYEISFYVKTAFGTRFITYTPESGAPDKDKRKIHHGLGLGTLGEEWHFIKRDLEADLQEAEPDNSISSVNGILIRGNGSIDDISLDSVR